MMWVALIGFGSGIISGMGIGGGTILIPALLFLTGIDQHQAQGINLIYFVPTAVTALCIHRREGNLSWQVAKPLALLGLAGAAAGALLAVSLESELLRRIFGGFLFLMGLSEILRKRKVEKIMQKDDFMKLKLQFSQADLQGKIAIYTETPGLSAAQYKELLRMYPYDHIAELEQSLAKL